MSTGGAIRGNPYVGPRSLRYGESIYGRESEARHLAELLIAERIALLYSPSGAGKTSLIQAALIPAIEKEDFDVFPIIRVSQRAVGGSRAGNPCVLSALLSLEQNVPPEKAMPLDALCRLSLADYLAQREAGRAEGCSTLLVFDQFEEILTVDPLNREAKTDFFNQVGTALRDPGRWALFAMREDHVAALDPYLRLIPTRLKATFRLDLLNAASALEAIEKPAREMGVTFAPGAAGKLVEDLSQVSVQRPDGTTEQCTGLYVEPVQLQVVCYRMWEKLPAGTATITEECLVGSSDVDTALADYYSERVRQIAEKTGVKERAIREWFDGELITEGGLRGQVMEEPQITKGLLNEAIGLLTDAHLVRCEQRRGVTWIELAHDRMVKPVRADNAKWFQRNLSLLQRQAALWNDEGKSSALCLRERELVEARIWSEKNADELNEIEREFLAVSLDREMAKLREVRRRRVMAVGAALALLFMSVLAMLALGQSRVAKRERDIATRQRNIATAQSIAAHALQFRDGQLDTALLLATEAQRRSDQPETRGSLLAGVYYNPRLTAFLHGSSSPISALAFNHDGTRLATGGFDGAIMLWDVKERRSAQIVRDLMRDAVRDIGFSPDGRYLAACGRDGSVELRDLRGAEGGITRLPPEFAHKGDVWDLAFSKDSSLLASGGSEGRIVIWNVATGKAVALSSGTESDGDVRPVRAVAFHPDGALLAAGCSDGMLLLWSRAGDAWMPVKRTFAMAPGIGNRVTCLDFSPDGKQLAAGRRSGAVDLYDLSAPDENVPLLASGTHFDAVSDLAFSPDGTRLVSSGFDGTLRLWEAREMKNVGPPFTGHVGRVLAVAFSPDGQTVASGGNDRRAILWDSWLHVAAPMRAESASVPFSIAFSPDGAYEADGYEDGTVVLVKRGATMRNADAARRITHPREGSKIVPIIAFSGDSRRLATTSADGKLLIRDTSDGAESEPGRAVEIDTIGGNERRKITAISLNKDGSLIAAALAKRGVKAQALIWKVATRELLMDGPLESEIDDLVYAVAFSPDSSRLATGGDAESASIWSLAGNSRQRPVTCREEHTGSIRSLAFSPDGRILATASGDNTLMLWNATTGTRLAPPLTGHQAPVVSIAFSPDGTLLASGSDDTTVMLWDMGTKQPTGRLSGHIDTVRTLAFSPDGKRLHSGSWEGESRAWELDPEALQKICRERANRNLTESEWAAYIQDEPYRKTWPSLPAPGW